jgi:REP element-mobilizing transposase RayT
MARPWRIRYAGAKYHVTVRGNGRQAIFLDDAGRARFLEQLGEALEQDEVILYAYVLMPNHYHLFIETPLGNVPRFMQRLNTAYSLYFRYKYRRPGHCLQGRYGAKLVSGDDYLVRLTRYLHLNPVKTEAMQRRPLAERQACLAAFPWSSYRGYVTQAKAEPSVDYRWLKLMGRATMAGNRRAYARYVASMVAAQDETLLAANHAAHLNGAGGAQIEGAIG